MCSLDAEKAFDSCNWLILFHKLYHDRHIPLPVVKVLLSLYQKGRYSVRNKNEMSYSFNATQGVFQGSILSPHLYNIYTEELLKNIENENLSGTSIYGIFTGVIAYADDIILLSSTINGLQKLLDKCTGYFNTTAISLNIDKTEFLSSGKQSTASFINLNHFLVSPQERLKHLGFVWCSKKNGYVSLNTENLQERLNKFWAVIHSLIKGVSAFVTQTV